MTDSYKNCTKCGVEKLNTDEFFQRHRDRHQRLYAECRECATAKLRAYRRKNNDKINAQRRTKYAEGGYLTNRVLEIARAKKFPFNSSAEMLVRGVRNRSASHDRELAPELLDRKFVEAWLRRQPKCECCGVPFDLGRRGAGHSNNGTSPSFDRFDPKAGYTLENTALICWHCNAVKKNYSSSDLRTVADWIDRRPMNIVSDKRGVA